METNLLIAFGGVYLGLIGILIVILFATFGLSTDADKKHKELIDKLDTLVSGDEQC